MTNYWIKMSFKTAFYAVLISAAAAAAVSCVENNRETGSGILPDGYVPEVGMMTFEVPVTNRISDSVQSSNSTNMLIGTISDPLFGTVTSNAASYIIPYSDSTDFGTDPELIGAYITLSIDSTYYLESNQEGIHQRIRVYRMTHELDSTLEFCNSMKPEYYDPVPVTVSDPVVYGTGQIRIDLTDEFASELLATTPEEFEDLEQFLERINGLYLEVEEPLGNLSGGRLNYLNLGYSTISLDYRTDVERSNGSTERIDTTESFVFGYYTALNFFTTGSGHLENSMPGDSLFLEGLSGVKPHISAGDLKSMLDSWLDETGLDDHALILSRAELTFPYEMPQDYERFNAEHPDIIYAFTSDPASNDTLRYYMPLEEVFNVYNIGIINRSTMQYSMDITAYVQQLLSADASEIDASMDLWIAPMLQLSDGNTGETYYSFDNQNYNKIILNGPTAERKPTLTLTYGVMRK